jgi:hypothetical protein
MDQGSGPMMIRQADPDRWSPGHGPVISPGIDDETRKMRQHVPARTKSPRFCSRCFVLMDIFISHLRLTKLRGDGFVSAI